MPNSGAPNSRSACLTRLAFARDGRTKMSRSLVARGSRCTPIAWPPTTIYSAPAAHNADNISTNSGNNAFSPHLVSGDREIADHRDTLLGREARRLLVDG